MASNFPSSLDSFTNPSSSDAMDSVSVPHATQHSDLNDAVEALQAKVGADSSAVTSSHDYKIAQLESISHGKILQIVSATHSAQSTFSSSTPATTGLTATITPTSATSKILVMGSFAGCNRQSTDTGLHLWLYRGATQVIQCCSNVGKITGSTLQTNSHASATYLDSPATTSATTYTIYGASSANSAFAVMNHTSTPTSTLTLLEVSA